MHSRTLEVFQDLGIVDEIIARAAPIRGTRQFAGGEQILHFRLDDLDSPFPIVASLEQWKVEEALENLLAGYGVEVERETELVLLEEQTDGVQATVRRPDGSGELLDTPWLIGCDGARSTVRHLKGEHFPGESYRLTPHYRHGRTFLAGDAAHIHSLVGGQGMNTGIQDAYNLGWKLALVARGRAAESLLDSYEIERRAVAEDVLAMTRELTEKAERYVSLSPEDRARLYRYIALRRRYGAAKTRLYLIRPDGYIGFRGSLAQVGALMNRLSRIFIRVYCAANAWAMIAIQ